MNTEERLRQLLGEAVELLREAGEPLTLHQRVIVTDHIREWLSDFEDPIPQCEVED